MSNGNTYQLIYADPPWQFRDKCNAGQRGAVHKYPVLSVGTIAALPVPSIAAPDCLLAMWWVPAMPTEALRIVEAWGFRLATMKGFTWVKRTKHGRWAFGMGHYTRANTEDCLFAVRGKWSRLRINRGVSQLIEAPVTEHSRKPDEAADRLVRLVGDVRRVELFARRPRAGWDVWGNEVEGISLGSESEVAA